MTDKPDNSYKPDYGLSRLNAGVGGNADHFFSGFRLYSLGVFDFGQYSTMVEISRDGHPHTLSLDFNQQQLRQILSKASPGLAAFLKQEISRDPGSPRTIDFDGRTPAQMGFDCQLSAAIPDTTSPAFPSLDNLRRAIIH